MSCRSPEVHVRLWRRAAQPHSLPPMLPRGLPAQRTAQGDQPTACGVEVPCRLEAGHSHRGAAHRVGNHLKAPTAAQREDTAPTATHTAPGQAADMRLEAPRTVPSPARIDPPVARSRLVAHRGSESAALRASRTEQAAVVRARRLRRAARLTVPGPVAPGSDTVPYFLPGIHCEGGVSLHLPLWGGWRHCTCKRHLAAPV